MKRWNFEIAIIISKAFLKIFHWKQSSRRVSYRFCCPISHFVKNESPYSIRNSVAGHYYIKISIKMGKK